MRAMIVFNHPLVGEYVASRAHALFNPATDNTIGVVDASLSPEDPAFVRGGVLFTNYTRSAIWLHMAGAGSSWATPTFLWSVFDYPFNQLGCRRVYGIVEAANVHALTVDRRLGFEVMTSLPDVFASGDGIVVSMTREQCKWLALKPRTLMENGHGRRQGRIGSPS
jgi:hypothetical protein